MRSFRSTTKRSSSSITNFLGWGTTILLLLCPQQQQRITHQNSGHERQHQRYYYQNVISTTRTGIRLTEAANNNNYYNNKYYYNDDYNNEEEEEEEQQQEEEEEAEVYYDDDNNNVNENENDDDNGAYYNNNNQNNNNNNRKNNNYENYGVATDDQYVMYNSDGEELTFDGISVMPVSCINYNGGNLIKFQLFENTNSYKCHFRQLGTFVVSIAHFMRAYFNYQALTKGKGFSLPYDAAYLNCVLIQETQYLDQPLYGKVGCLSDESVTSTRFSLHLYTDNKCTNSLDSMYKIKNGYQINGMEFSNRVSFRPPFYSCLNCQPDSIAYTFKKGNNWYDDDYINVQGKNKVYAYDDDSNKKNNNEESNEEEGYYNDNYYYNNGEGENDDKKKYYGGDDVYGYNNGEGENDDKNAQYFQQANDDTYKNYNFDDDKYYNKNEDENAGEYYNKQEEEEENYYNNKEEDDDAYYRRRVLQASPSAVEKFNEQFWSEVNEEREAAAAAAASMMTTTNNRNLAENNYYKNGEGTYVQYSRDIGDWNFCQRLHHYGMECDESCQALDSFRVNEWSNSDIFLLVIMCIFMAAMMLLIFAKRVKAYEKAHIYGDEFEHSYPGLPPMAMVLVFGIIMAGIILLARLKLVNETLVFAVVTCILLFIYMLKLTLFENRGPNLLSASDRVDDPNIAFDHMNRQLFDA